VEGYDNRNELDLSKAQEIIVFDKNKIKEIATVNNKTGEIKQSKTNSQNEPSTIKSNIPSSDKGTQVTEPTIKESETKVDQEEKIPIGETAETP
ncbi:hypothetical protein H6A11_08730, partial [Bifidobacterium pullorum subsp. saeculare]|uniref:hypothetical protein n=1 Tax=Bifidobacterium pullorum TaxID=78448 RepID=UPI00195AA31B